LSVEQPLVAAQQSFAGELVAPLDGFDQGGVIQRFRTTRTPLLLGENDTA
jgi:hypothetical protein